MVNLQKITTIHDGEYQDWLKELKSRYRQSQIKASVKVNSELLKFYWLLGRDIVKMKAESKWGDKFYDTLSKDLQAIFPNSKGFSRRNILYCKKFYVVFSDKQIVQQVVAPISCVP